MTALLEPTEAMIEAGHKAVKLLRGMRPDVDVAAIYLAMRSAAPKTEQGLTMVEVLHDDPKEPDDDALTDEQVERVAFFVEHSPTHPPGGAREMVSRKLVRQIIEAYRLQAKAPETDYSGIDDDALAREILNRHLEYMDGLSRGQVMMKVSNALEAVKEALAAR